MKSEKKCELLACEIKKILSNGIDLGSAVVHYIDSTFSNPTIEELKIILQDDSDCEKDSLVELLFFPDETLQHQLEDLLESQNFQREDEEKVLRHLCRNPLGVAFQFPEKRGSFSLEIPEATAHQFLKRLNISKQIDESLLATIKENFSETRRRRITVRIRNSRFFASKNALDFLCIFFEKWDTESNDVMKHLGFVLSFLEDLHENADIFEALMRKKRFYLKHLRRTENFEEQLLKTNMETLMLKGKIAAYIDKNEAKENMEIIDRVSRTVFGKTEYTELQAGNVESIELRSDQDIQNIIRRLS